MGNLPFGGLVSLKTKMARVLPCLGHFFKLFLQLVDMTIVTPRQFSFGMEFRCVKLAVLRCHFPQTKKKARVPPCLRHNFVVFAACGRSLVREPGFHKQSIHSEHANVQCYCLIIYIYKGGKHTLTESISFYTA